MPYDPKRHGPVRLVGPGFRDRVAKVVRQVPAGSVTTYGDIGAALGSSRIARQVGFALAGLPGDQDPIPWQRVVNGRGQISFPPGTAQFRKQRKLLKKEGVKTSLGGKVEGFAERRYAFSGLEGEGVEEGEEVDLPPPG